MWFITVNLFAHLLTTFLHPGRITFHGYLYGSSIPTSIHDLAHKMPFQNPCFFFFFLASLCFLRQYTLTARSRSCCNYMLSKVFFYAYFALCHFIALLKRSNTVWSGWFYCCCCCCTSYNFFLIRKKLSNWLFTLIDRIDVAHSLYLPLSFAICAIYIFYSD